MLRHGAGVAEVEKVGVCVPLQAECSVHRRLWIRLRVEDLLNCFLLEARESAGVVGSPLVQLHAHGLEDGLEIGRQCGRTGLILGACDHIIDDGVLQHGVGRLRAGLGVLLGADLDQCDARAGGAWAAKG